MDTPKFCSSGRFQGHLGLQTSVLCLLSNFPLFPTFRTNKRSTENQWIWISNINGLPNTGDRRQPDYRGKGIPGEKSSLLSLGTHGIGCTFARRIAEWGPSAIITRFSQSKNPSPFQGPNLSTGRCLVGGGEGKGVGATAEDTGVRFPGSPERSGTRQLPELGG